MIVGRNDKRNFIRMNTESEISFKKTGSDQSFTGKTIDLSATGIHFITEAPVAAGDMLEVIIKPGVDVTPPLETTVAVVRADKTDDGKYDVAGVMQNNED
jgi:hypothetical protein